MSRGKNFIPRSGIIEPRNLLNKLVPTHRVARSRAVAPWRTQLRFDLDPDVRAFSRRDLFLRRKFAWAHRLDKDRRFLSGEVDPTGLELQRSQTVIPFFSSHLSLARGRFAACIRFARDGEQNFSIRFA